MATPVIKAVAGAMDIEIEQGATFSVPLTWSVGGTPVAALNTWTARMHIRSTVKSAVTLLSLNTANSGIVLGLNPGEILLYISDADTAGFTWTSGKYDIELVSPTGVVKRLLEGKVKVIPEVTR